MSTELPKIFTDDEFDKLLQARGEAPRPETDRLDNAGVRPPPKPSDGLPESCIEQQFPHIAKKLTVVWPSEACAMYLTDLIVNKREGRQGFPPEVLEDLLLLHEINDILLSVAKRAKQQAGAAPFPGTPPRQR